MMLPPASAAALPAATPVWHADLTDLQLRPSPMPLDPRVQVPLAPEDCCLIDLGDGCCITTDQVLAVGLVVLAVVAGGN